MYLSDVAASDFYLFPKIRSDLKETWFESVESVKAKAADTLNKLTKEDSQNCFAQNWINSDGWRYAGIANEYIEGYKVLDVIDDE